MSAAYFICGKLYRFLVSENVPATPELLAPLAEEFRANNYDFGALVGRVLRSNLFFSPQAYRGRVKLGMTGRVEIVTGRDRLLTLLVKKIHQTISLN